MSIITAHTKHSSYPIYIDADLLTNKLIFKTELNSSKIMIVTDSIVAEHYLDILLDTLAEYYPDTIIVDSGEAHKNWLAIEQIITSLAKQQHDRFSTVITLGGGVVGDLGGFAASIYMRGINLIHVPTSLLAQVDACIGGKTGCNFLGFKNLIGTFYQPNAVIIDSNLIKTLPDREYIAGLAEIVKYGVACDADLFSWLELNIDALNSRDASILQAAIKRCCDLKAKVVQQDEKDQEQRMILNFGHTFAHAIESATDFNYYLHGEAVSIGMLLATRLAVKLGHVGGSLLDRLATLLQALRLPISVDYDRYTPSMLCNFISNDKKKNSAQLSLILPCELGKVKVFRDIALNTLENLMEEYAIT